MKIRNRVEVLEQLHRFFDEASRGRLRPTVPERVGSSDLALLKRGEITFAQYLLIRVEPCLVRLSLLLDRDDVQYLREACHEFVHGSSVRSGRFEYFHGRLRAEAKMGDKKSEASR